MAGRVRVLKSMVPLDDTDANRNITKNTDSNDDDDDDDDDLDNGKDYNIYYNVYLIMIYSIYVYVDSLLNICLHFSFRYRGQ